MFLHIAGRWGDATNHNLEFGGPGLASVPMNDRRTIATQAAEISADFTTFGVDDVCARVPRGARGRRLHAGRPGPGRRLRRRSHRRPRRRSNRTSRGRARSATTPSRYPEIEDRRVDQCFIGSCANGQLEDLRIAAEILDGRQVADGVRLIVTPASQAVYRDAVRLGYVETIADAGAVVTNSTCGACFGYHMGVLGDGEVCLTA